MQTPARLARHRCLLGRTGRPLNYPPWQLCKTLGARLLVSILGLPHLFPRRQPSRCGKVVPSGRHSPTRYAASPGGRDIWIYEWLPRTSPDLAKCRSTIRSLVLRKQARMAFHIASLRSLFNLELESGFSEGQKERNARVRHRHQLCMHRLTEP